MAIWREPIPERHDTRPRVKRYNPAVFEFLRITQGLAAAEDGLARLLAAQQEAGIMPLHRLDRPDKQPPGYPIVALTPETLAMTAKVAYFPWFAHVGEPLADRRDFAVASWKQARIKLLSENWEAYICRAYQDAWDAREAICGYESHQLILQELWDEVSRAICRNLPDDLDQAISSKIQLSGRDEEHRQPMTGLIMNMVCNACIEEQWSSFAQPQAHPWRRTYECLQNGRLPCGAVDRYPSLRLFVF